MFGSLHKMVCILLFIAWNFYLGCLWSDYSLFLWHVFREILTAKHTRLKMIRAEMEPQFAVLSFNSRTCSKLLDLKLSEARQPISSSTDSMKSFRQKSTSIDRKPDLLREAEMAKNSAAQQINDSYESVVQHKLVIDELLRKLDLTHVLEKNIDKSGCESHRWYVFLSVLVVSGYSILPWIMKYLWDNGQSLGYLWYFLIKTGKIWVEYGYTGHDLYICWMRCDILLRQYVDDWLWIWANMKTTLTKYFKLIFKFFFLSSSSLSSQEFFSFCCPFASLCIMQYLGQNKILK